MLRFNPFTGNLDYVSASGAINLDFVPLSTSGDYTIPTDKAFITGDEFTVSGTDTLSIEGTGRMILT